MKKSKKILSLCLAGRNDNYGGNFKRRFVQAMNFLAWSSQRAGVYGEIEVVFADWNSDTPVAQDIELSAEAAEMVRFVEIPPALAKQYNPEFSPFNQSIAFNCAFRNAMGEYAGIMPADVLLTSHAVRNLCNILKGNIAVDFEVEKSMLAIPRKNIPFCLNEEHYFSSPEEIEKFLMAGNAFMLTDNKVRGLVGGYGCFIMKQKEIFQLRGVDERIAGWGYNDIDCALRGSDHIKVVNTSGYGVWSYDFEASPAMSNQKKRRFAKVNPIKSGFAENPPDWGLAGENLKVSRCEKLSSENRYKFFSAKPDGCSYRNWISCLSYRLPLKVERISAAALAAGELSVKTGCRNIDLFGAKDLSIPGVLSIYNSFPSLNIHKEIRDDRAFFGLWAYDEVVGAMNYLGHVSYIPDNSITNDNEPQMFIFDDVAPDWEGIERRAGKGDIFIFSGKSVDQEKIQKFAFAHGCRFIFLKHAAVLAPEKWLHDVDVSQWHPLASGISFRVFRRHRLKKLADWMCCILGILFRRQIWEWGKAVSVFRKFRNSSFD